MTEGTASVSLNAIQCFFRNLCSLFIYLFNELLLLPTVCHLPLPSEIYKYILERGLVLFLVLASGWSVIPVATQSCAWCVTATSKLWDCGCRDVVGSAYSITTYGKHQWPQNLLDLGGGICFFFTKALQFPECHTLAVMSPALLLTAVEESMAGDWYSEVSKRVYLVGFATASWVVQHEDAVSFTAGECLSLSLLQRFMLKMTKIFPGFTHCNPNNSTVINII